MATISIDWQGHNTVLHFPSEDLIVTINMEWMPSIWNGCHQYQEYRELFSGIIGFLHPQTRLNWYAWCAVGLWDCVV